MGVGNGVREA